jgi:peroxiredoxin Q/BCP
MKWILLAVLLLAGLLAWRVVSAAKRHLPRVGEAAPPFELADQQGRLRTLAEFSGRWLVLYFYPRDETPGCTRQACGFRDRWRELHRLGADVAGVSVDSSARHAEFAAAHELPFTLLADPRGRVAAAYGSLMDFGLARFARRNTFIIDPEGRVARVFTGVNAARNAEDIAGELRRLTTP